MKICQGISVNRAIALDFTNVFQMLPSVDYMVVFVFFSNIILDIIEA